MRPKLRSKLTGTMYFYTDSMHKNACVFTHFADLNERLIVFAVFSVFYETVAQITILSILP